MSFSFEKLLSAVATEIISVKNSRWIIIIFGTISWTCHWYIYLSHSMAVGLVIMIMSYSTLEAAAKESPSRRTYKGSIDRSKSAPYSLLRILNFRFNSPSVSSRIACNDNPAKTVCRWVMESNCASSSFTSR